MRVAENIETVLPILNILAYMYGNRNKAKQYKDKHIIVKNYITVSYIQ